MKKHIIFISVIIIILVIAIPVNADDMSYHIDNLHICNEGFSLDNINMPMYIPHPCHSGISHAYCYYYSCISKSCGCYFDRYQCCCGELMPYRYIDMYYCDVHFPNN